MTTLPVPRWLQQQVNLAVKRAELDHWQITVVFVDTLGAHKGGMEAAETVWPEGYHDAMITFAKDWYVTHKEREVIRVIWHEVYHLIIAPEWDAMSKYRRYREEAERAAERFASIMMRAYRRKQT